MELLEKAGINFEKLLSDGIASEVFSQVFRNIGLIENPQITWLAFNSKYDFAYLLNLFRPVSDSIGDFLKSISDLFPRRFDVKHLGTGSLKE